MNAAHALSGRPSVRPHVPAHGSAAATHAAAAGSAAANPAAGTAPTPPAASDAKPRKRIVSFDVLNIVACMAVVSLHANQGLVTYSPGAGWMVALVQTALCMFCVPVFFMLSGATCMGYRSRMTTQQFLKRRFARTLIPLIIWSVISYLFENRADLGAVSLGGFVQGFVDLTIQPIYWFFFPLFWLYLLMPLLSLLVERRDVLWYFVGVCAALCWGLSTVYVLAAPGQPYPFSLHFLGEGMKVVAYAVLGYLLATCEPPRNLRWLAYLAGLAGLAFVIAHGAFMSAAAQQTSVKLMEFTSLPVAAWSVAVFLAVKTAFANVGAGKRTARVLREVSACSFGVYLIHNQFVLAWLFWGVLHLDALSVPFRLFGGLAAWAVAVAFVFVVKRVPLLGRIFP